MSYWKYIKPDEVKRYKDKGYKIEQTRAGTYKVWMEGSRLKSVEKPDIKNLEGKVVSEKMSELHNCLENIVNLDTKNNLEKILENYDKFKTIISKLRNDGAINKQTENNVMNSIRRYMKNEKGIQISKLRMKKNVDKLNENVKKVINDKNESDSEIIEKMCKDIIYPVNKYQQKLDEMNLSPNEYLSKITEYMKNLNDDELNTLDWDKIVSKFNEHGKNLSDYSFGSVMRLLTDYYMNKVYVTEIKPDDKEHKQKMNDIKEKFRDMDLDFDIDVFVNKFFIDRDKFFEKFDNDKTIKNAVFVTMNNKQYSSQYINNIIDGKFCSAISRDIIKESGRAYLGALLLDKLNGKDIDNKFIKEFKLSEKDVENTMSDIMKMKQYLKSIDIGKINMDKLIKNMTKKIFTMRFHNLFNLQKEIMSKYKLSKYGLITKRDIETILNDNFDFFKELGLSDKEATALSKGMEIARFWTTATFTEMSGYIEKYVHEIKGNHRPLRKCGDYGKLFDNRKEYILVYHLLNHCANELKSWKDLSKRIFEEYYGDKKTVYRGVSDYENLKIIENIINNNGFDNIKLNMTLVSTTTDRFIAKKFADEYSYGTFVAETEVNSDQVWGGWWNASPEVYEDEKEITVDFDSGGQKCNISDNSKYYDLFNEMFQNDTLSKEQCKKLGMFFTDMMYQYKGVSGMFGKEKADKIILNILNGIDKLIGNKKRIEKIEDKSFIHEIKDIIGNIDENCDNDNIKMLIKNIFSKITV